MIKYFLYRNLFWDTIKTTIDMEKKEKKKLIKKEIGKNKETLTFKEWKS